MRLKPRQRLAIALGASFALGVLVAAGIVMAMPGASHSNDTNATADNAQLSRAGATTSATRAPENTATATPAPHEGAAAASTAPTPGAPAPAMAVSGQPPAPAPAAAAPASNVEAPASAPPPPPAANHAVAASSSGFDAQYCTTVLDASGKSQCGNPPNFCDTWVGGFCQDYRDKTTAPGAEQPFPGPGDATSLDCLSSTNAGQTDWLPYYVPTNMTDWDTSDVPEKENIPFPCGISFMEHFMTRIEDGQFGMVVMRQQHPFDFAGRTGHIHFEVDLKTQERRYPRLVLSPDLTKVGVDDRNMQPVTAQSFEIWFRNGTFQGKTTSGGQVVDLFPDCNGCGPRYYGKDNVRDAVDVYISRTHVKILVNGATEVDTSIPDIGFDRAYVYLDHLNYNSCKAHAIEGYASVAECQVDGNMFHWDDVAYDGPTLPRNGLTPPGSEDVVFNAWAAASCTVKGVPAQGTGRDYVWQTWVARLPAGTPVSAGDVQCSGGNNAGFHWYRGTPMGLEIVQQ